MLCNFFLNLNSIFNNNEIDDIIVAYAVINDAKRFCGKQWIIIQERMKLFTENFIRKTYSSRKNVVLNK